MNIEEALHYDQETGVFTWKVKRSAIKAGDVAGCLTSAGYTVIRFNRKLHLAHRLAWFFVYGTMPELLVDHRNGVRSDNRIANLRLSTDQQNQRNWSTIAGASGLRGVNYVARLKKWRAYIAENGKTRHLGCFSTDAEAAAAYDNAARRIDVNFYSTNFATVVS